MPVRYKVYLSKTVNTFYEVEVDVSAMLGEDAAKELAKSIIEENPTSYELGNQEVLIQVDNIEKLPSHLRKV